MTDKLINIIMKNKNISRDKAYKFLEKINKKRKEIKICECLDLKEHKDKELIDKELLVKYYECKKCNQKSKNTYELIDTEYFDDEECLEK